MKGGGQQQPNTGNDMLWVAGVLVIVGLLIWLNFKEQIVWFIVEARHYELLVVQKCLEYLQPLFKGYVQLPQADVAMQLQIFDNIDYQNIPFKELIVLSANVGYYFKIPVLILAICMSTYLFLFHVSAQFKNKYSMDSLSKLEALNWPMIKPVVGKKLLGYDLDEGVHSMSLPPMRFAVNNDLVDIITKEGRPAVRLRVGAAQRVFALQLGPLWDGRPMVLPPYIQALFAIFAAKAEQDSDEAQKLIYHIGNSAQSVLRAKGKVQGIDFNKDLYMRLLQKHIRSKAVGRACGAHAYVYTMLYSMLELARTDGVIASSEFIWLKAVDRQLWYVLNNVGRQTAFCEVAGVFSHWKTEARLRRPLKVPVVTEAVTALQEALDNIIYNPDDFE
jgi:intracellular multiplication protein IcmP